MGPIMASKEQGINVLESWEDFDETDVLESKLKSLITPSKSLGNGSNGVPFKIILTGDDALRTQYVPPEPTVKILKRPSKNLQTINENKIYQPKKTLKQREQEYAEARLRILGDTEKNNDEKFSIQKSRDLDNYNNLLRLPKGPDGTKGFHIRR